jgi:hypothetical protein
VVVGVSRMLYVVSLFFLRRLAMGWLSRERFLAQKERPYSVNLFFVFIFKSHVDVSLQDL